MNWSCELTSTGWLVTWSGVLPPDGAVRFMVGMTPASMIESFVSVDAADSALVTLPDTTTVHPNASGRMDVYDVSSTLVEQGRVLPLIPGIRIRDSMLLDKLAHDHYRSSLLRGCQGVLYRERRTGTPCTRCTDPVTGAQLTHKCSVCGGSGRVAGWLGPFAVSVTFQNHHRETTEQAGAGVLSETVSDAVRLTAFPRPRANDRLFIAASGMVYIIGAPPQTVAGVNGIPAVVECPVRIPAPGTPESVIPSTWTTAAPDVDDLIIVIDGGAPGTEFGTAEFDGGAP
jgi:hypothetical protein